MDVAGSGPVAAGIRQSHDAFVLSGRYAAQRQTHARKQIKVAPCVRPFGAIVPTTTDDPTAGPPAAAARPASPSPYQARRRGTHVKPLVERVPFENWETIELELMGGRGPAALEP
jgi:hypothetical protein